MENAVIGVFDDYIHARDAADALLSAGFGNSAVQIAPDQDSVAARRKALGDPEWPSSEGWNIGHFFRSLFGLDAGHEHAHSYAEALRRGSFLVTAEADGEAQLQLAREVMGQFHPVDMEERTAHWRSEGWSRYDPNAKPYTDQQVQAERVRHAAQPPSTGTVQGAGATVRSFLREKIGVPGSKVPGTGSAGTTGSHAADAELERMSGGAVSSAATPGSSAAGIPTSHTSQPPPSDTDYRMHWQQSYGPSEGRYEDFIPAYRFGAELRNKEAFKAYHNWNDVEPEARRGWESGNAGPAWEQSKAAVRYGWEKMKG